MSQHSGPDFVPYGLLSFRVVVSVCLGVVAVVAVVPTSHTLLYCQQPPVRWNLLIVPVLKHQFPTVLSSRNHLSFRFGFPNDGALPPTVPPAHG